MHVRLSTVHFDLRVGSRTLHEWLTARTRTVRSGEVYPVHQLMADRGPLPMIAKHPEVCSELRIRLRLALMCYSGL